MTCYNWADKFDFRKGYVIKYDWNKYGMDTIDPNTGLELAKIIMYLYRVFLNKVIQVISVILNRRWCKFS